MEGRDLAEGGDVDRFRGTPRLHSGLVRWNRVRQRLKSIVNLKMELNILITLNKNNVRHNLELQSNFVRRRKFKFQAKIVSKVVIYSRILSRILK